MSLIIYVSLLLLTPKILSLLFFLKTMPSCPGLTPMLHSTIGLTAISAECYPRHQSKASLDGHLHFKENTFSKSANTFNNNRMWCLFLNWWHLTTLRWTGTTLCTLTVDITWPLVLIIHCLSLITILLHKVNESRSNGFLPDVYQILDGVIWLTPEKGHLVSTAPICWEQIEPSPEVSQQLIVIGNTWDFCLRKYAM